MIFQIIGIDGSKWQGVIDAARAKAAGARFAYFRASLGRYYRDEYFRPNFDTFQDAGIPTTAYHVNHPAHDPQAQIDNLADVMDGRLEDWPIVLDCEIVYGSAQAITNNIVECCNLIDYAFGRCPIIYTNWNFWTNNTVYHPLFRQLHLIVADYTYKSQSLGYPFYMPRDWKEPLMWQFSADGNNKGAVYGAQSEDIDLNYFEGTEEEFRAFMLLDDPTPPPAPEGNMLRVNNAGYQYLPLRVSPYTSAVEIARIPNGALVELIALDNPRRTGEVWANVEYNGIAGWCAWYYNSVQKLSVA